MRVPEDLSASERQLWTALQDCSELDLRVDDELRNAVGGANEWGPERQVRAEALTALVLGAQTTPTIRPRVLRLRGARITGTLRLRHARPDHPLVIEDCSFDNPIDLAHADIPSMSLRGSQIPKIEGYGLRIRGDLDLTKIIGGRVHLFGARIEGPLWLVGARLTCPDGYALDAPDMEVSGGMYCGQEFIADGGVNLYGTTVGAGVELKDALLTRTQQGPALRAQNLVTGSDLSCARSEVKGGLSLFGAEIGGQLWLNGASLTDTNGWALDAPNMKVRGGLYAGSGLVADGGVNLYGASVGAGVELSGAKLANHRGGPALRAPHATVSGDLSCTDGFSAIGGVALSGARIDGQLSFRGANLSGPQPAVLDCVNTRIEELFLDELGSSPENVLLRGATVLTLWDDATFQPESLDLDQTRYDMLQPRQPARARIAWLRRGDFEYQPWRYEQLAAHYRRLGHDEDARTVLLAKQRHRRDQLRLPSKLWGWLQDGVIGFGYRPARALAWLAAGIAGTTSYFAANPPTPSGGARTPAFSAFAYSTDIFLPVLDLGQQRTFTAHGPGQWVAWVAIVAGWILATTVIAGITRVISRA